jgi:3-oxoacyl-[acyl-carrier protein] reductase
VEGAAVSVWDRESEGVRDAVRTIEEAGGAATGAVVDLGDAISVREAAVSTVAELGAVTVLMNNASVLDDYAPIRETDEELWNRDRRGEPERTVPGHPRLLPSMIEAAAVRS